MFVTTKIKMKKIDLNESTQILEIEVYDSKTLYSLLLHLVDDRHPRSESPFWG